MGKKSLWKFARCIDCGKPISFFMIRCNVCAKKYLKKTKWSERFLK